MKTYTTIENHGYYGRKVSIEGESIVDAINRNWSEKLLPHINGNAAGAKVKSITIKAYDPATKRGDCNFLELRVTAVGQPLAHRPAGPEEYVTVFHFSGQYPEITEDTVLM